MYKFKKLVLALGLCGAVATGTAAADMKVGALFPFSGALALLGQESYRGLELAVNEINAAGGINGEKIQIVKADAVDPTQAVSETKRLISSNVIGVFGSYASGISYAASPVTELAGVPYFELGATAHKITTRGYKYLFRSNPNTALYGVSVVNAPHETIAPGMGLNPATSRSASSTRTAPTAPTWPPPRRSARRSWATRWPKCCPIPPRRWTCPRSSCV